MDDSLSLDESVLDVFLECLRHMATKHSVSIERPVDCKSKLQPLNTCQN